MLAGLLSAIFQLLSLYTFFTGNVNVCQAYEDELVFLALQVP